MDDDEREPDVDVLRWARPCSSARNVMSRRVDPQGGVATSRLDGWIELNVARGVDALLAAEELMFGRWHLHRFLKGKLRKLKGFEDFMFQEKDHLPIFGDFIFSLKVIPLDRSGLCNASAFGSGVWCLCLAALLC